MAVLPEASVFLKSALIADGRIGSGLKGVAIERLISGGRVTVTELIVSKRTSTRSPYY